MADVVKEGGEASDAGSEFGPFQNGSGSGPQARLGKHSDHCPLPQAAQGLRSANRIPFCPVDAHTSNRPPAKGGERMGAGTRPIYRALRSVSAFVEADRALDGDIAAVSGLIERREIPVVNR